MLKRLTYPLFCAILLSCATKSSSQSEIKRLSNAEFEKLMRSDTVQLLDVRTPEEYAQVRIKGARLIDIRQPGFEEEINSLNKSKKVLVYCAAGGRSKKAAEILLSSGFTEVYELREGINGWVAAGKAVE